MSHLKLYSPDSANDAIGTDLVMDDDGRPAILQFSRPTQTSLTSSEAISRARIMRGNATCPFCCKATVEPIELDDAMISPRSRLPIPGTSTLVGFHCQSCASEWPVYRQA